MSAIRVPSNSPGEAMRVMSATDLADRKDSRNLSDSRFRLPNSNSLVMRIVQDNIEQSARPMMTTFTTIVALMNMLVSVSLPASLISVGASAAAAGAAA